MPSDRSESRRGSGGRHRSIVLESSSRRSRSRTRARTRQSHRTSTARSNSGHGSLRRRSRRSPSRLQSQARSRSRSVVAPLQEQHTPSVSAIAQIHETTDRLNNRSRSKLRRRDISRDRQRRRRVLTPRRESAGRSRSPTRSSQNRRTTPAPPRPPTDNDVNTEILKCIKETLHSISTVNHQSKDKFTNNNVVPEFDPKARNQTIETWLNKVKECSEIYGWNSKQTAHYALPKLVGTAKKWYEGQPSVLHTWDEWVEKLKSAFPSYENYGHLLTEMLAKRAKFGDDLEEYYYEKLIGLNRCGIVGRNAIDCIVYGIDDRSVRYGAEAVGFEDADKLLGYLRGVKHEKLDKFNKKPVRLLTETTRKPVRNDLGRVVKCFKCHETGHVVSGCKKTIVKCQRCKRIGHDDPECNRNVWVDKTEVKTL